MLQTSRAKKGFGPISAIKKFYKSRRGKKKNKKQSTFHVEYNVPEEEAAEEFVVKQSEVGTRGQGHFDGAVSPPVRAKKSKRISLLTSEQTKIKKGKGSKRAAEDDLFVFLDQEEPLDLGIGAPTAGDTPSVIALNTELDSLVGQAASLVNELDSKCTLSRSACSVSLSLSHTLSVFSHTLFSQALTAWPASPSLKKAPAISKLNGRKNAPRARSENARNGSPLASAPVTRRSSRRRKAMAAR